MKKSKRIKAFVVDSFCIGGIYLLDTLYVVREFFHNTRKKVGRDKKDG